MSDERTAHDATSLFRIAYRVAMIHAGEIAADAPVVECKRTKAGGSI